MNNIIIPTFTLSAAYSTHALKLQIIMEKLELCLFEIGEK